VSHLTLQVFDALNETYQGTLSEVLSTEFVDEYNGTGVGTVTVPLDSADAALLVKDAVVRVVYRDAVRFSWFVETRDRTIAESGNQYILTAAGRGLLAWLEDAVVYPQGGLADFLSPERPFNYASGPGGGFRSSGNYQNAQAVQWRNDTTARAKLPVRWKDPQASWIWRTDPTQQVQRGTVNWFYRDFTLTESKRIKFFASADNQMDVFLDGQQIMSSSKFDSEAASFTQMARFTIRLGIGTHTLAARVRNDRPWERFDLRVTASNDEVRVNGHGLANGTQVRLTDKSGANGLTRGAIYFVRQRTDDTFKLATSNNDGSIVDVTSNGEIDLRLRADNTAGFILTSFELNDSGKEGAVVVRTNTNWQVSDIEPFWRPAMIVRFLTQEAATRGVYRLDRISFGYTITAPTTGTWTTEVDLALKVGSTMLTVLNDMVDLGHDFWLNPVTCRLDAWESRGTDRSATILLNTGVNLARFSSTVERPIKTVAVVRTAGGWLRAANNAQRETNGWRETFLEFGNTGSADVARRQAQRVLRRTGKTQVTASGVEVAVVDGAVPYVNFDIGDVVSIASPSGSGLPGKARILSMALKEEGGGVSFQPELEVLTDA
jgi:hypothetical protein